MTASYTVIAYGNYTDSAIFSNGSWITSLPLSNLQTRQLGRVARTSSSDPAGTFFQVDVGVGNIVRVFALLNHNLSLSAQFRLRGSTDPTFETWGYDSDWQDVWPAVYPTDQLEWESDNFWLGKYRLSEISGYPWHSSILVDGSHYLQYWMLEMSDIGNPDGFIQIGRTFIGDSWQPTEGIAFNCSIGWEDPSTSQTSLSSSEYFDGKAPFRVARLTTHFMTDEEAYTRAFEVQRQVGNWKELFYIHDTRDQELALRRRFPCRQRVIDNIRTPYPDANETNWELKEITP